MRQQRRPYQEPHDDQDAVGDDLAAVSERLDALTRQLERMAQANAEPLPAAQHGDERVDHITDAMARLDRRLDQVVAEGRNTAHEFNRRAQYAPAPASAAPPQAQSRGPANWVAQISARQRVLDAPPAAAPAAPAPRRANPIPTNWRTQISARQRALEDTAAAPVAAAPVAPAPAAAAAPVAPEPAAPEPAAVAATAAEASWASYLSGLQHQLHHLNTQISSLHRPYESAFNALRDDLADIGRILTEATPRRAIESLEGEIRALAERIDRSRQTRTEDPAFAALRGDLADIGRILTDAMPRRAIEALENEVRGLAERFERSRQTSTEDPAFAAIRRELAEIRDALQRSSPADFLGHFDEALRSLYYKVDQIAAATQTPPVDPLVLNRLEQAVAALRASGVASDSAVAQLADDVRGLGVKFERGTAESVAEAIGKLEARVASLLETGREAPLEMESSIRELGERLDRLQPSPGDQLALGALEDHIARLSQKLDTSDARLNHLEAIERGLADLLVHLEEMRNGRGLRAAPVEPPPAPIEPPPAPAVPASTQFAPPQPEPQQPAPPASEAAPPRAPSALDLLLPEPPAPAMRAPEPAPRPSHQQLQPLAPRAAPVDVEPPAAPPESVRPPAARTMPRGPQRQPIDPNLPPDTPLEPGSGAPRIKPGSAAARIAASEAALGNARPMPMETGGKSAAIAAARNAARAASLDQSAKAKSPGRDLSKWLTWPFKKAAKEAAPESQVQAPPPAPSLPPMPASAPVAAAPTMPPTPKLDEGADASPPRSKKAVKWLKIVLIAGSIAIIIAGLAQVAMEYVFAGKPAAPAVLAPKDQSQSPAEPQAQAPTTTPSQPMPEPESPAPAPSGTDPDSTDSISRGSSFFDPSTMFKMPDVTGSIPRNPAARAPARRSSIDTLPASIGPGLRSAAMANDPAAEYEIGVRYADGRGVPQSLQEAAGWFEQAAAAGFAPAQFRLGSLNEKGEGVRKDIQTARRLYLAAAGKGHAKAMHNLAVLYAEGIEGRPDYKAASEWFRKAASYGVTDSQYNLAILFARGIGLQANLAESYRWFALAAASGDGDAAKKRDEVAARLDPSTLATAKLAVQAFIPEHEPDEATNLKAPPGGWDQASAAVAKPRR